MVMSHLNLALGRTNEEQDHSTNQQNYRPKI
jgi:hypothetical protein